MSKMTRAQAEKFISEHGALGLLIALGVWTPEPEPVVEKTPWELIDEYIDWAPTVDSDIVTGEMQRAAEALGLKLIKASDELVAVDDAYAALFSKTALTTSQSNYVARHLREAGIFLAKRSGS